MSPKFRIMVFVLTVTFAALAGFTLSSSQAQHVLSTVASAVWGS